jgi:glucosamine-6-phosphate isomerase
MRLIIQPDANQMAQWAANYIAAKINSAEPTAENPFVLGLPTGSSPLNTYKALIKLYERGVVSFENVVTFNMDEYIGLEADHPQSYHTFMWDNFFNHIDIKKENVHILDGMAKDPEAECAAYEKAIKDAGGIDLFLGGIGPDGHIAFTSHNPIILSAFLLIALLEALHPVVKTNRQTQKTDHTVSINKGCRYCTCPFFIHKWNPTVRLRVIQ